MTAETGKVILTLEKVGELLGIDVDQIPAVDSGEFREIVSDKLLELIEDPDKLEVFISNISALLEPEDN